eukprot:7899297-Ditylum_brightwellii.AAC.1
MKERGEMAVDTKSRYQTDVQVKWNMKSGYIRFNIRAALITVLERIQQVDPSVYVRSNITNTLWKNTMDIPTGNEFSTAFDRRQETLGNNPTKVK